MTVALVKSEEENQGLEKPSAIVLQTYSDTHSSTFLSVGAWWGLPWATVGQRPASLLASRPSEGEWSSLRGTGMGRRGCSLPLAAHVVLWLPPAVSPGEGNSYRAGPGIQAREPLAAEKGKGSSKKHSTLTAPSYFAGAADKTGTRENQVGWGLLSSWGGGMTSGLGSPRSPLPMKFPEALFYVVLALFYVVLEILRLSLEAIAKVYELKSFGPRMCL